jgi:hypothetical protein
MSPLWAALEKVDWDADWVDDFARTGMASPVLGTRGAGALHSLQGSVLIDLRLRHVRRDALCLWACGRIQAEIAAHSLRLFQTG